MSSIERFKGKTALVTGAASGIGRASAVRLASEGASVLATDLDEAGLAETVGLVEQAGGVADSALCDVTDAGSCGAAVAQAIDSFGRLDVLCNIAGICVFNHVGQLAPETWDKVLAVNLSGPFYMSRAALPHLAESKGNIVNMASSAGLQGMAYGAAYCASKGGLVMLTKSMAVEFDNLDVRVNCICPGGVITPLVAGLAFPEDAKGFLMDRMSLNSPAPKFCQPEDIAGLVAYMASDEAHHMNGSSVSMDAGQVA